MPALVTVSFERVTQLPKDRVVNTWAIDQYSPDGGADDTALTLAFARFYGVIPASHEFAVSDFFGQSISRNPGDMKLRVYDLEGALDGSSHGSPTHVRSHQPNAAPNGTTPLPDEVAVVLTLEGAGRAAAPVSQPGPVPNGPRVRPMTRRTGRVYLGPLNSLAVESVGGFARVNVTFRSVILAAFAQLQDEVEAATVTGDIGVWSRKDGIIRQVDSVSIDNEFDTQRRRGSSATLRTRVLIDS